MEEIRLSELPEYLRDGELYHLMKENSEDLNEVLTFEANVLKQNTDVENAGDLDYLLNSLRFWGVSKFCAEIAAFVLRSPSEVNDQVLAKYEEQFTYVRALRVIKKTYGKKKMIKGQLSDAVEAGCVEVVDYLLKGKSVPPQIDACMLASRADDVNMLAFVHQRGSTLTLSAAHDICVHGHVNCLDYFHMNGYRLTDYFIWEVVVKFGHLACLQYLYSKGYKWSAQVCYYAAKHGQLGCLQYAHTHGCPWHWAACDIAADNGQLTCLQYAMESGCAVNEGTVLSAATRGHLSCLMYLHEQGCPWSELTCETAALKNQLDCLRYAHMNGCPWNENTCSAAASYGHYYCLRYAHEHGCPWNKHTCTTAAFNGHLDCLVYAHENGCKWSSETYAAVQGKGRKIACAICAIRVARRSRHLVSPEM